MDNPFSHGSLPGETRGVETPLTGSMAEPGGVDSATDTLREPKPGQLVHLLAGLQAGVVGVFWMLACFAVAALWSGHSIWTVPNLFSTAFYGDDAFQDEFLRTSWAGLALLVVLYGLLGIIWGWWWKDEHKPLLTVFGALTGLVTYYLFFSFFWPFVDSWIPLYAPVRQLQLAHILWGAALAGSPGYSTRIIAAIKTPVAVPVTWMPVATKARDQDVPDPVVQHQPDPFHLWTDQQASGAAMSDIAAPDHGDTREPASGQEDAGSESGELIR